MPCLCSSTDIQWSLFLNILCPLFITTLSIVQVTGEEIKSSLQHSSGILRPHTDPATEDFASRCQILDTRETHSLKIWLFNSEEFSFGVRITVFWSWEKKTSNKNTFTRMGHYTRHSNSICSSRNTIGMHLRLLAMLILWSILDVSCVQIPWIDNASIVPMSTTTFTNIHNSTCDQCICTALANHSAALNCFLGNDTCQLFDQVPIRYRLQPGVQAKLYFISGSVPNASQCCMPDLNVLLDKLKNATMTTANQPSPRCLAVDNHGYIVTIKSWNPNMSRFSPSNLTLVDVIPLLQGNIQSIAFHGDAYYIGSNTNSIEVVDSNTVSTVNIIMHPNVSGVRDMIFLRDGQTMVVASTGNNKLVFFNRSSSSSVNYTYSYAVSTSYPAPHGLWYVNDSFFYATSWDVNSVYSYVTTNGVTWNETLFANVNSLVSGAGAAHVTVDECGRKWVSRGSNTTIIYDSGGTHIGNFILPSTEIFDTLFMDNYVMYLSDSVGGKIIRFDPHVACWNFSIRWFYRVACHWIKFIDPYLALFSSAHACLMRTGSIITPREGSKKRNWIVIDYRGYRGGQSDGVCSSMIRTGTIFVMATPFYLILCNGNAQMSVHCYKNILVRILWPEDIFSMSSSYILNSCFFKFWPHFPECTTICFLPVPTHASFILLEVTFVID